MEFKLIAVPTQRKTHLALKIALYNSPDDLKEVPLKIVISAKAFAFDTYPSGRKSRAGNLVSRGKDKCENYQHIIDKYQTCYDKARRYVRDYTDNFGTEPTCKQVKEHLLDKQQTIGGFFDFANKVYLPKFDNVNTADNQATAINNFASFLKQKFGKKDDNASFEFAFSRFSYAILTEYLEHLYSKHTPLTANKYFSDIKSVYLFAMADPQYRIKINHFERIRLSKGVSQKDPYLYDEDNVISRLLILKKRLLKQLEGGENLKKYTEQRLEALDAWLFAYYCGVRPIDIYKMKREDVDINKKVWRFWETKTQKTKSKKQVVRFADTFGYGLFRYYWDKYPDSLFVLPFLDKIIRQEKKKQGSADIDFSFIYCKSLLIKDGEITKKEQGVLKKVMKKVSNKVYAALNWVANECGFVGLSMKSARQLSATIATQNKGLSFAQAMLNHSNSNTTRMYEHSENSMVNDDRSEALGLDKIAEKIEDDNKVERSLELYFAMAEEEKKRFFKNIAPDINFSLVGNYVQRVEKLHSDKPYDYRLTVHQKTVPNVVVKCRSHGLFEVNASKFLKNKEVGCPYCLKKKQEMTTIEFVHEAQKIHGKECYDFSAVVYEGDDIEVNVICKHGTFAIKPKSLLEGRGCSKCTRERNDEERKNGVVFYNGKRVNKKNNVNHKI